MTKKKRKPHPDMPDDPKVLAEAIFREADRRKKRLRDRTKGRDPRNVRSDPE